MLELESMKFRNRGSWNLGMEENIVILGVKEYDIGGIHVSVEDHVDGMSGGGGGGRWT